MQSTKPNAKVMSGILVALIATTMVFAVHARKGKGQQRDHRGFAKGFLTETLELTDTQQKKVDALKKNERTKVQKIRKEMNSLRDKMRAQWEKETVDKKTVRSLQKKMHNLKGKIGEARTEFRLGVYDILTQEQRKKAATQIKTRHNKKRALAKANANCPCGQSQRGSREGKGHRRGPSNGPGFGNQHGEGPMW